MTPVIQNWIEVWFDESASPPYLLLVQPDISNPPEYLVYDPKENYKVVFSSHDYEQVRLWLREDEYVRIEGRNELSQDAG